MNSPVPIIGIDFGTSNSKMAWYNPRTNQAEIIMNREGEAETPSIVYFGKDQTLIGRPAQEMLEYEQERERIIMSIKRELVSTPVIALPGKSVKPVEVAAEILRKLKRDAEEQHFHQPVTSAVITYPASFGPLERDKIHEAARLADFTEVELLEEPVAAAMAYAQMGLKVGKYVLVYDLGGGTFDLAVLACEDDGSFRLAMEPQGFKHCGGDDFDQALYDYCDQQARRELNRPISLKGKRDLHFLQQCRQRKEHLSNTERRMFKSLLEPGAVLFQYELDRPTFEGLISARVEETVRKTKALVEQASTQGQAVDTLVLIGGSSRVPLVQRLLEQTLPLRPLQWQNRDVAVALGAAYHAYNVLGADKQYRRRVEQVWADKKIDRKKIAQLYALAEKLSLSDEQVNSIERQVMGEIKEVIFGRQLEPEKSQATPKPASKTIQAPAASKPENFVLAHTLEGHTEAVFSVAFSPDGGSLASGSDDKTIRLWDVQTGQLLHTLQGHTGDVRSVAFSPDGRSLASGSDDTTIRLWDVQTGQLLHTLQGHTYAVFSVAFSPEGGSLASGSGDKTIRLWDVQTGQLLHTLQGHTGDVSSVAFSPFQRSLASGSYDKTIRLWDAQTRLVLLTLQGHRGLVHSVAFSPDGHSLASGSYDKTIRLWNGQTGQVLCTLQGHRGLVHSVAFSPDGGSLASGSGDKTIKIWRAT